MKEILHELSGYRNIREFKIINRQTVKFLAFQQNTYQKLFIN